MAKSVYSLVLMDEIVDEIDRLAYRMNTNRSNMINQILAEYVSFTTPEKRMQEVFTRITDMLTESGIFQPMLQPSDSMLSVRSALAYKYNPTVRYSVELQRSGQEAQGRLKVSLRSQNRSLMVYWEQFFTYWIAIENAYAGDVQYELEPGRYVRLFKLPETAQSEQQGEMIAEYIQLLDDCMKLFFDHLNEPQQVVKEIEARYLQYRRLEQTMI